MTSATFFFAMLVLHVALGFTWARVVYLRRMRETEDRLRQLLEWMDATPVKAPIWFGKN